MGMRRNIKMVYAESVEDTASADGKESNCIYFYTHWGAEGLEEVLAQSLERARTRWDDPAYLARVIFTDMTKDAGDDITGYGIAPWAEDPEYPTLAVNLAERTVNGIAYEEFISNPSMFSIYEDDEDDE